MISFTRKNYTRSWRDRRDRWKGVDDERLTDKLDVARPLAPAGSVGHRWPVLAARSYIPAEIDGRIRRLSLDCA
jgi:hypothetical protein